MSTLVIENTPVFKIIIFENTAVDDEYDKIKNVESITMKKFNSIQSKASQDAQDEFLKNIQSKLGRGSTIKIGKTLNFNIELNFDDSE